jgi:hypothetical protein
VAVARSRRFPVGSIKLPLGWKRGGPFPPRDGPSHAGGSDGEEAGGAAGARRPGERWIPTGRSAAGGKLAGLYAGGERRQGCEGVGRYSHITISLPTTLHVPLRRRGVFCASCCEECRKS